MLERVWLWQKARRYGACKPLRRPNKDRENVEDAIRKNPQDVNRGDTQLKRERRPRPESEAVQPRDGKHLLKTSLVKS